MPTKAACPKEVNPPSPVINTSPSATKAATPMKFNSVIEKGDTSAGATAKPSTAIAIEKM